MRLRSCWRRNREEDGRPESEEGGETTKTLRSLRFTKKIYRRGAEDVEKKGSGGNGENKMDVVKLKPN
jgi:hypothetical protein